MKITEHKISRRSVGVTPKRRIQLEETTSAWDPLEGHRVIGFDDDGRRWTVHLSDKIVSQITDRAAKLKPSRVTDDMRRRAANHVRDVQRALGRTLTAEERRNLLMDDTPWESAEICAIVREMRQ